LFLSWGIALKNPGMPAVAISIATTVFLRSTALADEKECLAYFGTAYQDYMQRTKRFIPFVI
jgi:protein-S-isoprenylcysteine O-methyltransferase Ste14